MHTWFHVQLDQKILDGLYGGPPRILQADVFKWWTALILLKADDFRLIFYIFTVILPYMENGGPPLMARQGFQLFVLAVYDFKS